jgi:hypothetical protein
MMPPQPCVHCELGAFSSATVHMALSVEKAATLHLSKVEGEGLRPIACSKCGFEYRRRRRCLSLVNAVCCQVEVSATGLSPVQRSPTDCGVSLCVISKPQLRGGPGTRSAVKPRGKKCRLCMYVSMYVCMYVCM